MERHLEQNTDLTNSEKKPFFRFKKTSSKVGWSVMAAFLLAHVVVFGSAEVKKIAEGDFGQNTSEQFKNAKPGTEDAFDTGFAAGGMIGLVVLEVIRRGSAE